MVTAKGEGSSAGQKVLSCLLIGSPVGEPVEEGAVNPYVKEYRTKRDKNSGSAAEDEQNDDTEAYAENKGDFVQVDVVEDEEQKPRRQKLFELVQEEHDATKEIARDMVVVLATFLGYTVPDKAAIEELPETFGLQKYYKFLHDCDDPADDPETMTETFKEMFGDEGVSQQKLAMYMELYGDDPMSADDSAAMAATFCPGEKCSPDDLAKNCEKKPADIEYLRRYGIEVEDEEYQEIMDGDID